MSTNPLQKKKDLLNVGGLHESLVASLMISFSPLLIFL